MINRVERPRVKSFVERKNEEAELLQKKEQQIKQQLTTIKNNQKFSKVINISLITLENLISKDNSEHLINIKLIIKLNGIKILCNITSVNSENEEIIDKATMLLKNLIKNDNKKTFELSKIFLEKNGQNDIFQLLISLKNDKGIYNLLEIIYILIPIPQFFNILMESEMIDTIKFLIEFNFNKIHITNLLNKIIAKITNHKKGRDLLINDEFVKKIRGNIEKNIKEQNQEPIIDELIILDNILKNDNGKIIIKKSNIYKNLSEGLSVFFDNERITSLINKINIKLISIEDIKEKIDKIKSSLSEGININGNIDELVDLFNYLSNLIFVEEVGKIICSLENIKLIFNFFCLVYSANLKNKNEKYLINYIFLMKYFMIIFKRMTIYNSEFLNEQNEYGKILLNNKIKIFESAKKIYEGISQNENINDKKEIIIIFKLFFSDYCDIFLKIYIKNDNSNQVLLFEYILEKIIFNSDESFYKDEKLNYYFSFLLKIIFNSYNALDNILMQCFPYFKNVIKYSQNNTTLSNIIETLYNILKLSKEFLKFKNDIIPTINKFMLEKPHFRYPNLINLKMLDMYLTPELISNNEKIEESNKNIEYINPISSVMVKGYKPESDTNIEKSILIEGSKLLKRLVTINYFKEKIEELNIIVKKYKPEEFNQENIDEIKNNIYFHISALNINEFLIKEAENILNIIKDLITKEINYIENYKKENSKEKETNLKYSEKCSKSTNIINICLNAIRKIEDGLIINYNQNKDQEFIDLIKLIINLNIEVIENSSDSFNLVNHLKQLRKNIFFLINNEKILKFKEQTAFDIYINSLVNLLRKNITDEDINFETIKTFISFGEYNKEIFNILMQKGSIKLILQFLNTTNNSKLCFESIHLLKNICFSSQKNLITFADQNIMNSLCEIHIKFINDEKIINLIDLIINEIKKLPGQGVHIEDLLLNAFKNFEDNINKDFNSNQIQYKLLNDLIIINSHSTNKIQIKKLISKQDFINNFFLLINKSLQEKNFSQIIDKLFTCEIELMKKIIIYMPSNNGNLIKENDKLIQNICDLLLNILFHNSIFADNFLLTCKALLYFINNENLYSKFLSHKIDKKFIEQFLEQEENYNDNIQISKVMNKIISFLALKSSVFARYIVKKGGFIHIIEDLKTLVNLNDSKNKMIKYNSIILIESLLLDDNNMEILIKCNGVDLMNNLIKQEVNFNYNKNIDINEYYKSICCINCGNNNINIIRTNKKSYKKRKGVISNDIIIEENYYRSTVKISRKQSAEIEDNFDKDNNYIYYCMKIITKCLSKGKNEFLNKNIINNLILLSEEYFPDKNISFQLTEILSFYLNSNEFSKQNTKNDFILNKLLLKLLISNIAYFYTIEELVQKIKVVLNKLGVFIFKKEEYIYEFKNVFCEKYDLNNLSMKFNVFTYLSILIDIPSFRDTFEKIKNEIIDYFNDILLTTKKIINNNEENNISNYFITNKEGIILSLIKIYNYLINNIIINKNDNEICENINYIEKISSEIYIPNNYNFVYEYEKEISKLINENNFPKHYLNHIKYIYNKLISFIKDFYEEIRLIDFNGEKNIINIKEINLCNILSLVRKYYKISDDKNIKEDSCVEIFEELNELLELLFDDNGIKEYNIKFKDISFLLKLIWKIIFYCFKYDAENKKIIIEKILNYDIFSKLTKTINNKENNRPSLRKIPLIISENNPDQLDLNELLFNFINNDIKTHGKSNPKIKQYDIKILSNLSNNYSIMKLILQDKTLSQLLKDEYSKSSLTNDERLPLAIIFKNSTKNGLKPHQYFIPIIFSKLLKDPIKNFDNNGKIIIETEVESVINIMKNKILFGNLIKKNIVTNDDMKKIENVYINLDKNISKQFKQILIENEVDKKIKQTLKSVNEDENKIIEIEKIVMINYQKHTLEYIKFFDKMKKEDLILNTQASINNKKRILDTKEIRQEKKIKEKIKTSLSMVYNQHIYLCISEIVLILIKNFNMICSYKEDQYNNRRINLINKSFNLLQILSLAKDNHLSILKEGFINLLEKINEEYKSIQLNKEKEKEKSNINEAYNKFIFNSLIKAKYILKECSQYENSNELILDSPIFSEIISYIMNYQNVLNGDLKKIFIYDNVIIANVFSVKKFQEQILDKLDINIILELGIKSGNILLLENIADLILFYFNKNKNEKQNEILDKIFLFLEQCIKNKNSSSILMTKILDIIIVLYSSDYLEKIEQLKIIEFININIKKFSLDNEYIYSAINCLVMLIKNNQKFVDECFNNDIISNIKIILNNYSKEMPSNYILIIWKATEFYYLLLKKKPEMIKKMCELNIPLNIVIYLDIYNNKVLPISIEEKAKNILLKNNENKLINYVKEILMNCVYFLNIITSSYEGNDYLSQETSFNKYLILAIENENNDKEFLNIGLQCLSNYFKSDTGQEFLVQNIVDIFHLLTNMQYKYSTDVEILISMNNICNTVINCGKIQKNYVNNFFDILIQSIKYKEIDLNLIIISLTIIRKSIDKNNFLIESINSNLVSNLINILSKYKYNYEIQYNCYTIISFIIDETHISIFSDLVKDIFIEINQAVTEFKKEEEEISDNKNKLLKEQIKDSINDIIIFISNIKEYSDFIISEILIPFIQELNDININEEKEVPFILIIFDDLLKNKDKMYINPFINNNGHEKILSLLKQIDKNCKNIKIILKIFNIIKSILKSDDDYKIKLQNLNLPEIINNLIKLDLDKKIEFEGKSIIFLMNKTSPQLEKIEDIEYTNIQIIDPIGPVIKNYLTSGKIVKVINKKGVIKEMQLSFNQDLTKVHAKSLKSNLPPKSKYVIEINNIKSIIKGHGTNIFKKCGGFFTSIPKAENCFSIIGPLTEDGTNKAINVICNSEKDADKWIKYMEIVLDYFRKKKLIGFVKIIKETKY